VEYASVKLQHLRLMKTKAPKPTGYPPKKDIPKYTDNFRSIYDKRLAGKMQKNKTFQSLNAK
jgi:hypothetical protein